jgi:hypothetical protein
VTATSAAEAAAAAAAAAAGAQTGYAQEPRDRGLVAFNKGAESQVGSKEVADVWVQQAL